MKENYISKLLIDTALMYFSNDKHKIRQKIYSTLIS